MLREGPSAAISRQLMSRDFCCRLSIRFEQVQPGGFGGFIGKMLAGFLQLLIEEGTGSNDWEFQVRLSTDS